MYPTMPLSASYTTVLSQDVVNADTVAVDSGSPAPVAPFTNPASGGQANNPAVEALVVTSDGKLGHLARDLNTDAGWKLVTFHGVTASEVVAGTAYASGTHPAVYGLYQSGNTLNSVRLQADGTFGPPTLVSSDTVNSRLRATYSPAGQLLAYGQTDSGDLVVAFQPDVNTPFETQTYCMPAPLSDGNFFLCMSCDEVSWTMLTAVDSQDGSVDKALWMFQGVTGDGSTEPTLSEPAPNYSGSIQRVVSGFWSPTQEHPMFLFVDACGVMQAWANGGRVIQPVPALKANSSVAHASAQLYVDPNTARDSIHVYTIDGDRDLAVLHQDPDTPWTESGAPNWATYLPLARTIRSVAIDRLRSNVPTVFAIRRDTCSLELHTQDPVTRMWRSGAVLQSSQQAFEVVRHRLEVNIVDAAARPVPNYPVNVGVAPHNSGADVWVAGRTYPISSNESADLTTDSTGKLTVAFLTHTGLAAPNLVLSADGLSTPLTLLPALGIHSYLAGGGPLNPNGSVPLDPFDADGTTLRNATVSGLPLAPATQNNSDLAGVAARAIQQTTLIGLNRTPPGVAGFRLDLADPRQPLFNILTTSDEVAACIAAMHPRSAVGDFFSDLWQSMRNGLTTIVECVVDCANKVLTLTARIGHNVMQGITLAMDGLEQAAQCISGIFQSIAADVEDVLNWLKAVFDFGAIWRTKMAFQHTLDRAPAYLNDVIQLGRRARDGWFTNQLESINASFATAIATYQGTAFADLDSNSPALGNQADNPHHNWLQDKVAAYAGSSTFGLQPYIALQTPWQNFANAINGSSEAFIGGLEDLVDSASPSFKDPTDFGRTDVGTFLEAMRKLIPGLLEVCDAALDAFLDLAAVATDALSSLLRAPIDIEALQALWSWMATRAGYADDSELTVASFVSLLAAFPTTLPAICADLLGANTPMWLSLALLADSILTWARADGHPELHSVTWESQTAVVSNLLWIAPTVDCVMQSVTTSLLQQIKADSGEITSIVAAIHGAASLILDVVLGVLSPTDASRTAAGLLLPLPAIFSFANHSTVDACYFGLPRSRL